MSNTDVALCLYDADARVEDDIDKVLMINVVQDVNHELEDDHDVLLYLFSPESPSQLQGHDG